MKTLLVLGATSDIARATARAFAFGGWNLCLAGRNMEQLHAIAADLSVRSGCDVQVAFFDACQPDVAEAFWGQLSTKPDAVLCAVGLLGNQHEAEQDPRLAETILRANFTGLVPVLSEAANAFEQQGSGLIIGISSVAGDRGRASNYVYGSAKAGFTAFLSGLRNRLASKGVHVMTVKPGFVATTMTEGLNLPPLLTATPEQAAQDIFNAAQHGKDVVYTRWFWRWIMTIICLIPEKLFKKKQL